MKILLVRNDNIGDLICTTPAIEALRKKYKDAQIDIVVNSYNYDGIYKNPFINTIYTYTKPKHKKTLIDKINAALGKIRILIEIRKTNYDAVVVLRRGYSKSAELFSKITNAKNKVGVKNPKGKDNFNIYVEKKENQHEVEFCFECFKFLNLEINDEKTRFFIDNALKTKYIKYSNFIAFHISARMERNQMQYKKIYGILELIKDKNIIITAEPKDYEMALKLEKNLRIPFIKTNSFVDLGGLFSNLKLVITLEGGAMHLSSAVGTKTIALFGQSKISRWYPWGYKNLTIQDKSKIANNISIDSLLKCLKNKI